MNALKARVSESGRLGIAAELANQSVWSMAVTSRSARRREIRISTIDEVSLRRRPSRGV